MPRKTQGEDSVLRKIADRSRSPGGRRVAKPVALGIGDDAALFQPSPGHELVLTCDWFLEGTHFLREKHPPDSVGWKCLARALSDIAAMGGLPRCFLLSLALPKSHTGRWLDLFLGGLRRASQKFRCFLAGGDTTRRNDILINVTVLGEVRSGRAIPRSGARPGDILYVSGRLGEAELGLQMLRLRKGMASRKSARMRKHFYPEPRLALGHWLAQKRLPTAMMDLSDGLSTDLGRLCASSRTGARIEERKIPMLSVASWQRKQIARQTSLALKGGDDYELMFTVPPRNVKMLPKHFKRLHLTPIGVITRKPGVRVITKSGREQLLQAGGWDPFR